MDSTRVLVLGSGKVVEFDSPANLLEKKGGAFADLVREARASRRKSSLLGQK
jgi:ABC-type multidrug transport system fused ATPase/permease subunit